VRILDEADALRHLRSQADERTKQFPLALFRKMFGEPSLNDAQWPVRTFEELTSSTQLGLVRGADEMDDQKAFAYLRMDSILGDGRLRTDSLRRVDASEKEARDYSLQPGDFLFNTRNSRELVGKTAVFSESKETVLFNNNIMRIRFSEAVNPHFVLWLFHTPLLQNELEQRKSGTTSVVAIYWKALKTIPILVPPIDLQRAFAAQIEEIHALETAQTASRWRLDDLFQSLLHRAFQGEL
jgi:type I restriction enzyme S subunit